MNYSPLVLQFWIILVPDLENQISDLHSRQFWDIIIYVFCAVVTFESLGENKTSYYGQYITLQMIVFANTVQSHVYEAELLEQSKSEGTK